MQSVGPIIGAIGQMRERSGYLRPADLIALFGQTNVLLDPFSIIISANVVLGSGNVLYPGTILDARNGAIVVGNGGTMFPGTLVSTDAGCHITIGNDVQLGDGGCRIKANVGGAEIVIRDSVRLIGGPEVVGKTYLGRGTQVLGPIGVQSCVLGDGESSTHPDPDGRGAVLKGSGVARGLILAKGEVVNGNGDFSAFAVERQSAYHPKPTG